MSEHAQFPPSALHIFTQCHGAWRETQARPELPQSTFAAKGALLHEYVVRAYEDRDMVQELDEPEDRFYVLQCLEYLEGVVALCGPNTTIKLETKVSLESYGLDMIWGTADVLVFDPDNLTVHVIDWKFGHGVAVFANLNPQGIAYMGGALAEPEAKDFRKAVFHICQPPKEITDSFEMIKNSTPTETGVVDYIKTVFKLAVVSCLSDNPTYHPSPHACQFCRAKADCKARYEHQLKIAQEVFSLGEKVKAKVDIVDDEILARILDYEKEFKAYVKHVKDHIFARLRDGVSIPHFKLVRGRVTRKYKNIDEARRYILDHSPYGDEDLYKIEFKTPTQIEALDKTFKKDPAYQELIFREEGKLTIAKESDKRPAWNKMSDAIGLFSKIAKDEDTDD